MTFFEVTAPFYREIGRSIRQCSLYRIMLYFLLTDFNIRKIIIVTMEKGGNRLRSLYSNGISNRKDSVVPRILTL